MSAWHLPYLHVVLQHMRGLSGEGGGLHVEESSAEERIRPVRLQDTDVGAALGISGCRDV